MLLLMIAAWDRAKQGLLGFVFNRFSGNYPDLFRREGHSTLGQFSLDALSLNLAALLQTFLSALLATFHFSFFGPRSCGFSSGEKHSHSSV